MEFTQEHKNKFLDNLIRTYQENIWKDEINHLQCEENLGTLRTDLAGIDLQLDRKEFNSAREGKKAQADKQSEFEAATAALAKIDDKLLMWKNHIEIIQRYSALLTYKQTLNTFRKKNSQRRNRSLATLQRIKRFLFCCYQESS